MGNTYADKQNHDQNEDVFHSSAETGKSKGATAPYILESNAWNLVKGAKPRRLILSLAPSETGESWFQERFLKQSHGLRNRVPKHLVSLDEKYLRRCLELMHINASKGAPCALSVNLSSSDMGFMPEIVTVASRNSLKGTKYAIDYPTDVGTEDLDVGPIDEGIVGSIMGSSSMMNILRSPVFQRLGISYHEAGLGRTSLFENKRFTPPDYQGFPGRLTLNPSRKPGKKTSAFRNQEYRSDSLEQSPISTSSGLLIPTDQSSASSFSPSYSQGMLQCTWEGGIPHFAFSLDDQFFVANAWRVEVANCKPLDYVYSFHLKPNGAKMCDFADNESDLIGKMKVLTSFSLCSNNSTVMETEFVLVGTNETYRNEMHTSIQNNRRTRKFSKVMEVFKSGNPLKLQTPPLFGGTGAIPEDLVEKGLDVCNSLNQQRTNVSEIDFPPNLEMAAIIVKHHIQHEQLQKEGVGGWGLKFLKKAEIKQSAVPLDASASSEFYTQNARECSTSMDIIVPAGRHGGPKAGPTSLIERWKLGGHCDCGGWDIGCPLKVLKAKAKRDESSPSSESPSDCKSFDVLTEASKQGPALKMVNIHEGLYFISFQSRSLSALQCFSIAVAIIHSQSPSLRPKHVHD